MVILTVDVDVVDVVVVEVVVVIVVVVATFPRLRKNRQERLGQFVH